MSGHLLRDRLPGLGARRGTLSDGDARHLEIPPGLRNHRHFASPGRTARRAQSEFTTRWLTPALFS
jgi:hypothetical protein